MTSHRSPALLILVVLLLAISERSSAQAGQPETGSSVTGNIVRTCLPSTLEGYSCMLQVLPKIYHLHWIVHPTKVSFAIEGQTQGWAAFAWSPDGGMLGSNAVVGFATGPNGGSGSVEAYNLGGFASFQVVPSSTFTIESASIAYAGNGTRIIRFDRLLSDSGDVPWNTSSNITALYAYSESPTLGYHGPNNRGSFKLVLGPPLPPTIPLSTPGPSPNHPKNVAPSDSGSTCEPSTRPGYICQRQLQGDRYILHWNQTPTVLRIAADVATTGWASLGWSPNGKMAGSDVVIANTASSNANSPPLVPYHLDGYKLSEVKPSENFGAGNLETQTLAHDGRTTLSFDRPLSDSGGVVPLMTSGPSSLVWAYSANDSKVLRYHHKNRGSVSIDFSALPTVSPSTSPLPSPQPFDPSPTASQAQAPSPSTCGTSSLGYNCALKLQGDSVVLHWTTAHSNISLALQAATTGWAAVGWSPTGRMVGSTALISATSNGASTPTVDPFALSGYNAASITPAANSAITGATVAVTNGKTVIRSSLSSPSMGPQHVIWAFSSDGSPSLSYHGGNKGSALIDFQTNTVAPSAAQSTHSGPPSWVVRTHGLLMGIAFAIILPFGLMWPAFGKMFVSRSWFPFHVAIQILGVVAITVAAIISFMYLPALDVTHGRLGLAIIILVWIQPFLALVRPHPGAHLRRVWFASHWLIGVGAIVAGWVNVFIGLNLYVGFHGKQTTLWIILVVLMCFFGSLYVISVLLRLLSHFFPRASPTSRHHANGDGHVDIRTKEEGNGNGNEGYNDVENIVGSDEEFRWTKAARQDGRRSNG